MVTFRWATLFMSLYICIFGVNCQANFETSENYIAERFASVPIARGIIVDDAGDVLVISRGRSRITSVFTVNGTVSTVVILEQAELNINHGIAYNRGYLYASSPTTVYRWPYTPGQRTEIHFEPEIVVKGIPNGGHLSRALIFDKNDRLYVSVGSDLNVDPDSSRSRIRRFNLASEIPSDSIDFNSGEVFADGIRNEVGFTFDQDDILWGVQNGADMLYREDLGGEIHNTNPADELTKYDQPLGTFYGYPYCWTVDELENNTRGDQFSWPDFLVDGIHTDEWCKNKSNNHPPTLALPAHFAALGITFYDGKACNSSPGAFPCSMKGDAFVTFHGSWNREPAGGYKVVRIPIDPTSRLPTGEILDVMYEPDPVGCGRCFRPVDITFNQEGHLIVSADASSEIFKITYAVV